MVAGAVAATVGAVGLALDAGDGDPQPDDVANASTSDLETSRPNTTASEIVTSEDPVEIVAAVLAAISAQDADFLVGRLAPATVDRYGLDPP